MTDESSIDNPLASLELEGKQEFVASIENEFGREGEFSYLGPLGKELPTDPSSKSNNKIGLSIGIGLAVGIVIVAAFIGFLVYRKHNASIPSKRSNLNANRYNFAEGEQQQQQQEQDANPSLDRFDESQENEFNQNIRGKKSTTRSATTRAASSHQKYAEVVVDKSLTADSLTHVNTNDNGDDAFIDVEFDVDAYSLETNSLNASAHTSMTPDMSVHRSSRRKEQRSRSSPNDANWSNRWGATPFSGGMSSSNRRKYHRRHPSQDNNSVGDVESQDGSSVAFSYTEVGASGSFGGESIPSVSTANNSNMMGRTITHQHRRNHSGLSQDSYEGDEKYHGGYQIDFDLLMEDMNEEREFGDNDESNSDSSNNNKKKKEGESRTKENSNEDGVECALVPSPTSISKFRRVYSEYSTPTRNKVQQTSSLPRPSSSPPSAMRRSKYSTLSTTSSTASTVPIRHSQNSSINDSNTSFNSTTNMNNSINTSHNQSMLLSTSRYIVPASPSDGGEIPFDEITNTKLSNKKVRRITPPVPPEKLLKMPQPKPKPTTGDDDSLGGDDIVKDLSDFLRERRRAKQDARSRSILDL